jgi:hypothetical protein
VTAEEIERIVREVMKQLGTPPVASPSAAAPAGSLPANSRGPGSAGRGAETAERSGDGVLVESRVVTLESIAGRLDGKKQVIVASGAIVTPAVRDELRRKGIALVRSGENKKATSGLPPVLLVVGRTRHDPDAAVQVLRQAGVDVATETSDCMIASTDKLAAAVADRSLGLLWTRHTAAGLCLANRHAGVRAVLAMGVAATAAAVAAVGANVLVVDPTAGTAYEKMRILREFCQGGIRPCPEALKERLEK